VHAAVGAPADREPAELGREALERVDDHTLDRAQAHLPHEAVELVPRVRELDAVVEALHRLALYHGDPSSRSAQ
jgi:hypothetical protein